MKDDIFLDYRSCIKMGLLPVKPPIIPTPKKRYNEVSIPGRDGIYYEDLETYDDIVLPIEFNFRSKDKTVDEAFRYFRRVLADTKELMRTSDPDMYYKIKKIEIGDLDRGTSETIGTFQCDFTLDPYAYLRVGKKKLNISKASINSYDLCKPMYVITGEGNCEITVNGTSSFCNVTDTVYIDTDLQLCYRDDGTWINTTLTGNYDDMYLKPGKNDIRVSDGFTMKIIPNWRTAL